MQSKETISEELRLISEFVAAIPRVAPSYTAPEGYFEDLATRVMERIKQNPYAVPQGYFEEFAGKLIARIKAGQIGDSREELSVLSPLLDRIDKRSPFQAPEGYFSNLTGNVLSGVQAIEFVNDELENTSPLMTDLRGKAVYQAPEGYFDELSDTILARLKRQQSGHQYSETTPALSARQAPVISMGNRRNVTRKWFKYAAAAVMTGLILTMGWLNFHNAPTKMTTNNDVASNLSLSKVSDQEILNYLENQNIPLAETITNSTATLDINDADVKNILGNVSDDELKQYIDDNGGTKDLVTN